MTATLTTINLDTIATDRNVRRKVGDIRDLSASIEAVGLLNPLTVTSTDAGFELIAGHRRLAALRKLGRSEAPAYVIDEDPDARYAHRVAVQLVENLQREDLTPLDEATGLAELVELVDSQKAAAEAIGRSQGYVSKRLKLLELSDDGRAALAAGGLSLEDAFELSKLDFTRQQKALKGLTGNGSRWELARQIEEADRDKKSRKAARAVARQKHREGIEVVAVPDVPKGWKSLEGYDGLAVDWDLHAGEPCHRLVVGYQTTWAEEPSEVVYCAEPSRHDPGGDSPNKTMATAGDAEERARRQAFADAQAKSREDAARLFANATNVANATDRNDALKVIAVFLLDGTRDERKYLEAVGVKLPDLPDTGRTEADHDEAWTNYRAAMDEVRAGMTIAQLYRAAVLFTLDVTVFDSYAWKRDGRAAQRIAEILDLEIPTDDEKEEL